MVRKVVGKTMDLVEGEEYTFSEVVHEFRDDWEAIVDLTPYSRHIRSIAGFSNLFRGNDVLVLERIYPGHLDDRVPDGTLTEFFFRFQDSSVTLTTYRVNKDPSQE